MIWNIIRKMSLLHRRRILEALLMMAASAWVLLNIEIRGPGPMFSTVAVVLVAIGASLLASLAYWVAGLLGFVVQILWALCGIAITSIQIRTRLRKASSL